MLSKHPSYHPFGQLLLLVAVILISVTACIKERFDPDKLDTSVQVSPGVAAPIGYVHYKMEELLSDSLNPDQYIVGEDGFITMLYRQDLISWQASDVIQVQPISFLTSVENDLGVPINAGPLPGLSFSDTIWIPVTIGVAGEAKIDSLRVRSMDLTITPTSAATLDGEILLESENITQNSTTYSHVFNLDGNTHSQILQNQTLHLDNLPPHERDLAIIYTVTLDQSDGTINPGDPVMDLEVGLSSIEYSAAYGYLGQFPMDPIIQSIPIDFYDPIQNGTFHFTSPSFNIYFGNSFGIPIDIYMDNFQATSPSGQTTTLPTGIPSQGNPMHLAYPSLAQEGMTMLDSIILTRANSDFFDILETSPTEISFEIYGTTNPGGITYENFILDTSRYWSRAELWLPLEGYADFMLITDTLDFIFDDFYDNPPEEIESLTFRLNFWNGMPVNVFTQVYFADENLHLLDSLFMEQGDNRRLVPGATDTDGDGKADPPDENYMVDVSLSRGKIDNISSTRYIFLSGRITTPGFDNVPPDNVKFYSDYFFRAHLAAIAELYVNSAEY